MDETLRELVSRHLDGDLDEAEAARLDERARTDAELAAEIDTGRKLRQAVAALADRMEPPATLDKVMDPLRTSAPAPVRRVRPVYRWLGAAATVVFAVTVVMEVARRNPEPTIRRSSSQRERPMQEREEIFELAPLPTANPDDRRPLGATDRLLEEEMALPPAPEPAPLEVMGPLPTDGSLIVADDAAGSPATTPPAAAEIAAATTTDLRPAPAKKESAPRSKASAYIEPAAPQGAAQSRAVGDGRAGLRSLETGKAQQNAVAGGRVSPEKRVVLQIGGAVVWSGSTAECEDGRRPVRIDVRNGEVVSVATVLDETGSESGELDAGCQPRDLIGAVVVNVGDGVHLGEIIVGGFPP